MAIVIWQSAVAISIMIARAFSYRAMIVVALCWTAFTFLAVWAFALILLQLATAWGTVWLLTKLFGQPAIDELPPEQSTRSGNDGRFLGGAARAGNGPIEARPSAKTTALRNVERLVSELMASDELRDDTRNDLSRFLADARAGCLHPDDLTYLSALHARIVGAHGHSSQTITGPNNAVRVTRGAPPPATEPLLGLAELAKSADRAIDRLNGYVASQLEKQEANSELRGQLSHLRVSMNAALKSGEQQLELNRHLERPRFAEEITESVGVTHERHTLRGVTLAPVDPSSIPRLALDERIAWLSEAVDQLNQARSRISRDAKLLAAVNSTVTSPFDQFLAEQLELLKQHVSLLSPQTLPPSNKTPALSITRLDSPSEIAQQQPDLRRELESAATAEQTGSLPPKTPAPMRDTALRAPSVWHRLPTHYAEIERLARELQIPHLVHFTRCENLPGILEHGLMSVAESERRGIEIVRNDGSRWDGQLDGTSLSVSFPNYRMFYKCRQEAPDADWAVLLIAPRVLWQKDCAFYCHNAADRRMIRRTREEMKTAQALRDMFSNIDGREEFLKSCDPTDPQAEVMVYETIEPDLIEAIAFETVEVSGRHRHCLGGVESFYAGAGQGLFGPRRNVRAN